MEGTDAINLWLGYPNAIYLRKVFFKICLKIFIKKLAKMGGIFLKMGAAQEGVEEEAQTARFVGPK